jgi:hypothetical protein
MTFASLADASGEEPTPDEELGRLLRSLALSEQFHFYVVVCATPRIADALLDELASKLPAERGAEVRFVRLDPYAKHEDFGEPLRVDEAVSSTLEQLVYPPEENQCPGVVHVLDTSQAAPDDEKALRWLFGRMNERRNHVTRALGGELVLLATPRIEQLFVEAAPDFWSIRSDTYVFREGAFAARSRVRPDAPLPTARRADPEALEVAPFLLAAEPSASAWLESAAEGRSSPQRGSTTVAVASAQVPPRWLVDDANAQFKPFLQFVRDLWSVPSPGDLSDPAHAAEVLDGIDAALTRGWRPRPARRTRSPWRRRPWASYSPEELAAAAQVVGRTELAGRIYRAVLSEARDAIGAAFDPSVARVALLLAATEVERGRVEVAQAIVGDAEETMGAPRRMDYLRVLWWLQGLGLFYRCLPDQARALEKFGASLEFLEHLSDAASFRDSLLPEGLVLAAESALALGPPGLALAFQWSTKALDISWGPDGVLGEGEGEGSSVLRLRAWLALGRALQALGGQGRASHAFGEAARLAQGLERSHDPASAAALASAAEALDEYANALAQAGNARRSVFFRELADRTAARALRQLRDTGIEGFEPEDLKVEWGTVVEGQPRPLPNQGAMILAGDCVSLRLANRGKRRLYVHVVDLGVSGKVTLLTQSWPSGVNLGPGEDKAVLGEAPGDTLFGVRCHWPDTVLADSPRSEELVFIVTDRPTDLRGLARQSQGGQDTLEWLKAGTFQGGLRELTACSSARTGLHVRRIRFLLAP